MTEKHPKISVKLAKQKLGQVRNNVRLARKLFDLLSRASPHSSGDLVSGLAVDLADLVHVGQKHLRFVQELLKMRLPRDRERLCSALVVNSEVNLFFENQYHLRSLQKGLPRFLADICKRRSTRHPNTRKSAKRAPR
jgi:hypothetical protein